MVEDIINKHLDKLEQGKINTKQANELYQEVYNLIEVYGLEDKYEHRLNNIEWELKKR